MTSNTTAGTRPASAASVDILRDLVSFDTTSRNSNIPLIAWVEDYLANRGVRSTRVYDPTGTKANLWATIGPADQAGYVLSGHTDTVPVDGQDWASDPFRLVERDGRLYGRGTTDMKGFLAVALAKVPDMLQASLKRPIHLCFSHDEEIGCIGVRYALERIGDLAPVAPVAAFIGEPTSMQVIVAHKGKHNYRVVVTGKPVHSSLAPAGVNAIDYAAELILKIRDINRRFAEGPRDEAFDIPVSTAHTGVITGGTVLNIVPESCEFAFEFRMLPGISHQTFEDEVRSFARDVLEPRMKAIDPATGIVIELVNGTPGFDTDLGSAVIPMAKALAGRNDHAKVAYGTEAGLFVHMAGVPSIVVGPGSIEQAHRPDEFIEMAELGRCERFIDRLIERCC
ncbi:acetylornithine deacetylase [Prosthecomicrobium hirschii]|uniref:Acetylornithine deacetylase n=1 Tax=Prosthecodimorpha hirschii TaxID=665126 RepID=A0A0P6VVY2_9HYPH|nr:acetylornithine deacetylase [Prosthecomicrobium hirschii]KPL55514.1 acetylornithine deacetylase [Prosthecomicrobium hirschii]